MNAQRPSPLAWDDQIAFVMRDAKRRELIRNVIIVVGACLLAPMLISPCTIVLGFVCLFLPLWKLLGYLSHPGKHTLPTLFTLSDALPHTHAEQVPEILLLADALQPTGIARPYRAWDASGRATSEALDALDRLLPHFQSTNAIQPVHRRALRRIVIANHQIRPHLTVTALLVLADTGDRSLVHRARYWRRGHPDERMREAANEYLLLVENAS